MSGLARYTQRVKPVEAIQWSGTDASAQAIMLWVWRKNGDIGFPNDVLVLLQDQDGLVEVHPGDYIVHTPRHGFRRWSGPLFEATYERKRPMMGPYEVEPMIKIEGAT